eukprot:4520088-Pleurochrysis_carterae.AAC.1
MHFYFPLIQHEYYFPLIQRGSFFLPLPRNHHTHRAPLASRPFRPRTDPQIPVASASPARVQAPRLLLRAHRLVPRPAALLPLVVPPHLARLPRRRRRRDAAPLRRLRHRRPHGLDARPDRHPLHRFVAAAARLRSPRRGRVGLSHQLAVAAARTPLSSLLPCPVARDWRLFFARVLARRRRVRRHGTRARYLPPALPRDLRLLERD